MNNITLAHIGGELVLVGGVVFYFHKKTSMLQQEILLLKKEQKEQADILEELRDAVQQLGSMVVNLQRNARGPASASAQASAPAQSPVSAQAPVQSHAQPLQTPAQSNSGRHHKPHHKPHNKQTQAQQPTSGVSTMSIMSSLLPAEHAGPVSFPPSRKDKGRTKQLPVDEDSGAETYDDRELDNELAPEYEQLGAERECEGDTCKLLD